LPYGPRRPFISRRRPAGNPHLLRAEPVAAGVRHPPQPESGVAGRFPRYRPPRPDQPPALAGREWV